MALVAHMNEVPIYAGRKELHINILLHIRKRFQYMLAGKNYIYMLCSPNRQASLLFHTKINLLL